MNRKELEEFDKKMNARTVIESKYEWRKWADKIPFINWPSNWLVKAVPPFGGAVIRYFVSVKNHPKVRVSVYLDCYDELGFYGQPYWEMYPHEGDCYRCDMHKTDELIKAIDESFAEQMGLNDE